MSTAIDPTSTGSLTQAQLAGMTAERRLSNMNVVTELPPNPEQGDMVMLNGQPQVWNGTAWVNMGDSSRSVLEMMWESTPSEPPTGSEIRGNGSTPETTTKLWVRFVTADGVNAQNIVMNAKPGNMIIMQNKSDSTAWVKYNLTAAPVGKTGYGEFTVTFDSKGSTVLPETRTLISIPL